MSSQDRVYHDYLSLIPSVEEIDPERALRMVAAELELYKERTPKSFAMFQRARRHLINGVPTTWHSDWRLPYSFYVARAKGVTLWDIDGNEYLDFNLADTPAIFGHSPDDAVTRGIAEQLLDNGVTTMAPTEDAVVVSELLSELYGLPYWYVTLSASDSGRNAINIARSITRRSKILMFNMAYHGTPFRTDRMGARTNISFLPDRAYDAKYALRGIGFGGLHEYWTYYCLNRDVLLIPFFNMIITSPCHTAEHCGRVVQLWDEAIANLYDR